MLGLAWRTRDWSEVAGQVLRLALVPLGHLSGRLPLGNPGWWGIASIRYLFECALINKVRSQII